MKKFVKITTRKEDGTIFRTWIGTDEIIQISQNSLQEGNNEGTIIFDNGISKSGTKIEIIDFNATIESLS
jgi:hypothetical protein